jgi:hypothetical protein
LFHAIRGDLLSRLRRHAEADRAYRNAVALTQNETEHTLLTRVVDRLIKFSGAADSAMATVGSRRYAVSPSGACPRSVILKAN